MKLLTKAQVYSKKNQEAKFEIDQGSKLAERIDQLRKTNLQEEEKLKATRIQMVGAIKEDVDNLSLEVKNLKDEIERLREERIKLREPLDEEWKRLTKESEGILSKIMFLDNEKTKVLQLQNELQDKIDSVSENMYRSLELKLQSEELYRKRLIQHDEIKKQMSQLSFDIDTANKEREQKGALLANRETRVSIREKELELKIQSHKEEVREFYLKHSHVSR